ncbi:Sulfotransferase domain [Dillenia turbinata]|uniref:Sulfotransferase n=1 Tax=Dillenia turbinata TaxID=194707 RepID=A0AAN8ZC52_9MAGN
MATSQPKTSVDDHDQTSMVTSQPKTSVDEVDHDQTSMATSQPKTSVDEVDQDQTKSSIAKLPKEKWWADTHLLQFKGFWLMPELVKAVEAIKTQFNPLPTDIILASFPKSGTTWLKALTFSILNLSNSSNQLVLTQKNPHEIIPFLEMETFGENPSRKVDDLNSPRIFNTHLPYPILSDKIKTSGCRIIYIRRNPADTFVSLWHFYNKILGTQVSLEQAFDEFCRGCVPGGPFFEHVLGYWQEREKKNIFLLKYEELKKDPTELVGKLADFLGCSLNFEEIQEVVSKCSFDKLRMSNGNRDEADDNIHWTGASFDSFFRQGVVGDSKNYLTTEMVQKLDLITNQMWDLEGLI